MTVMSSRRQPLYYLKTVFCLQAAYIIIVCLFSISIAHAEEAQSHSVAVSDIYAVMFYGLNSDEGNIGNTTPRLSKSSVADILTFLKNFPIPMDKTIKNISFNKRYRFVQSYFGKNFLTFGFGNENNKWKGKLYSLSFTLKYPGWDINETETRVYKKLSQFYGKHPQLEKFRFDEKQISEKLNLYLWRLDKLVATYRSFYDANRKQTVIVVRYWDSDFYNKYQYYNF
jgi:hypothetical protein